MEAVESVSLSILIISQVEARGQQPLQWKLWSDRLTCLLATGEIAVYQVILFVCLGNTCSLGLISCYCTVYRYKIQNYKN